MKKIFCIKLIAFTAILLLFANDCKKDESAGKIPSCVTQAATNVYAICATLNGTISYNNSYGSGSFEYGTSTSYGSFAQMSQYAEANANTNVSADIRGLTPGTTYHFRIKAGNILGTDYGDDMSFSTLPLPADHTGETGKVEDADGNVYQTIGIGSQIWIAENLKTTRYRNGDLIGTTTPSTFDISGESTPKYQWAYDGDESNVIIYGRLYTWHAVSDSRNVCPAGWHLPEDNEWTILTDYLLNNCYGYTNAGRTFIAQSMANTSWSLGYSPSYIGNNSSGFTALPGGYRENTTGKFYRISIYGSWWSSTESSTAEAYYRSMSNDSNIESSYHDNKQLGFSVRCLKDN